MYTSKLHILSIVLFASGPLLLRITGVQTSLVAATVCEFAHGGPVNKICQPPPTVLINKTILQRRRYDVTFETAALYYAHPHPKIRTTVQGDLYRGTDFASPEILSEPPQTQDDSINSIQETLNTQFRLVLSVTPCMARISSIESVNPSPSPLLFSPTPTASPAHAPTPDSPRCSHHPLQLAPLTV